MGEKHSINSFDIEELKNQMEQIKNAKKEYEENGQKEDYTKQPLGQKIIGIIILIALVIGVGFAIWTNLDTMFLPKNSITITVTDQNGETINGLKINLQLGSDEQDMEFTENSSSITILDATAGEYTLTFEEVPEGYSTDELVDTFILNQDGKVNLKYQCTKEN